MPTALSVSHSVHHSNSHGPMYTALPRGTLDVLGVHYTPTHPSHGSQPKATAAAGKGVCWGS
jgi:hypothetical protein